MRFIFSLLLALLSLTVFSQKQKVYYRNGIKSCIEKERKKVNEAILIKKDYKLGDKLFKSLVEKCIKDKYFVDYNFKTIDNKNIDIGSLYKPILIITSATWCKPCSNEISALNKVVEKHHDAVEFVVLFWDKKEDIKAKALRYNKKINLIPATTKQVDSTSLSINGFNHKLGFPAAYLIHLDKRIIDFYKGTPSTSKYLNKENANQFNEKKLLEFIKPYIK